MRKTGRYTLADPAGRNDPHSSSYFFSASRAVMSDFGLRGVAIALATNDLSWNERDLPHICAFRKLAFLMRIQRRRDKWQLTTSPARSPHE
jgi:hypothetical protein